MKCKTLLNAWLLSFIFFCLNGTAYAFTFEIKTEELNRHVHAYFPIFQNTAYSTLKLADPVVVLDSRNNKLGIEVTVSASVTGLGGYSGRGQLNGDLEYRRETYEFYLHNPKLKNVQFVDAKGNTLKVVHLIVDDINKLQLPFVFVYRLSDEDFRERMAKNALRSVVVTKDGLVVDIDMPF